MSIIIFIISTLLLVAADQYTKILAINHLQDKPPIPLIKDIFELTYVENEGSAFGMFQGRQGFFIIITAIILSIIVFYYFKYLKDKKYNWLKFCFILITSGALGNLIDRIFRGDNGELFNGKVVDFFYFKLIDFPVFNVADCYVVVGTILFAILIFTRYREDFLD